MATTEDQIREARLRIAQMTANVTRKQVERDNAKAKRDEAVAALREFGVTTGAEAKELRTKLQTDLQDAIDTAEQKLQEAEA